MRIGGAMLCAGALLLAPWPARAETLRVEFTSEISSVPTGLESQFSVGELVTGSFEYDPDSLDDHADPDLGQYPAGALGFQFGSYAASSSTGLAEVNLQSSIDHFAAAASATSSSPDPVTGDPVGDFALVALVFRVSDDSETFFPDDSLPLALPLSSFSDSRAFLTFEDSSQDVVFLRAAPLESIVVPEPGGPALPLCAAAVLGALRLGGLRGAGPS